jgi:Rieske Fe-S protein
MQKYLNSIKKLKQYSLAALLFLLFMSCEETGIAQDNMPPASVNLEINLRNMEYRDLEGPKGWVYINNVGLKGIVVYKSPDGGYIAMDRACPHDYDKASPCGRVEVDNSNFFMKDECCGSTFDMEGYVQNGPASRPLRKYFTAVSEDYLYISSEMIFDE